jgi:hypothetical protein
MMAEQILDIMLAWPRFYTILTRSEDFESIRVAMLHEPKGEQRLEDWAEMFNRKKIWAISRQFSSRNILSISELVLYPIQEKYSRLLYEGLFGIYINGDLVRKCTIFLSQTHTSLCSLFNQTRSRPRISYFDLVLVVECWQVSVQTLLQLISTRKIKTCKQSSVFFRILCHTSIIIELLQR